MTEPAEKSELLPGTLRLLRGPETSTDLMANSYSETGVHR